MPAADEVWSSFDLPRDDPKSHELSGLAWDSARRVLWAVQDDPASIVTLIPDRELRAWKLGERVDVAFDGAADLEGIVALPDGFIVSSEDGPRIVELDRRGRLTREIDVPPRYREARSNRSFESLTMSPSGRYLFTTTEAALERDGDEATPRAGTRVRILRFDLAKGETTEHAYETDPVPYEAGDWGVSDLAACSDTELFVLERGWSLGHGNTVRIYGTKLDTRASCAGVERLSRSSHVLAKALRVDLSQLVVSGLPAPRQPQAAPLLDNYEGMALGPHLPGGRPSLVMVSDDNGHADQVARVLVLALGRHA